MKTLLSGVIVVLATSYVAMAQPAYSPDEGGAPANYPPCTHRGEDRCVANPMLGHGHAGRHHQHHHHHHH